jgi:hypothetical protein
MCLKTPHPVIAEHAARFEVRDHRWRPHSLNRWKAVGAIEGHHPYRLGTMFDAAEYP